MRNRPAIIEGDIAKIPLGPKGRDGYAVVDIEDAGLAQYAWSLSHGYAATRSVNGNATFMHRLIMKYDGKNVVDHIDRDILNNRKSNLEVKTQLHNVLNSCVRRDNTSGHKGICWDRQRKKWLVRIGDGTHIGRFIKFEDAIVARRDAELKVYGHRLVPILERSL